MREDVAASVESILKDGAKIRHLRSLMMSRFQLMRGVMSLILLSQINFMMQAVNYQLDIG